MRLRIVQTMEARSPADANGEARSNARIWRPLDKVALTVDSEVDTAAEVADEDVDEVENIVPEVGADINR